MDGLAVGLAGLIISLVVMWIVIRNATRATELVDELRRVTAMQKATIERMDAIGVMLDKRLDTIERKP